MGTQDDDDVSDRVPSVSVCGLASVAAGVPLLDVSERQGPRWKHRESTGRRGRKKLGSCLKTSQHFIFVIIYLLLPIKLFNFWIPYQRYCLFFLLPIIIIMILIMKIMLHNEYKIINLWYPTYVYQFFLFFL